MKKVTLQEQIDDIMDNFNFRYVAECIYRKSGEKIPFIPKEEMDTCYSAEAVESYLRKRARRILKDTWERCKIPHVANKKFSIISGGGFEVCCRDGLLELKFVLEDWEYCSEDPDCVEFVD